MYEIEQIVLLNIRPIAADKIIFQSLYTVSVSLRESN